MSSIRHDIQHGLTLEQASKAAHLALDHYLQRYAGNGLGARWATNTRAEIEFSTHGAHLRATVDVLADVLRVEADVPLLMRAFKGKAIAAVEREALKWIQQVKAGSAG